MKTKSRFGRSYETRDDDLLCRLADALDKIRSYDPAKGGEAEALVYDACMRTACDITVELQKRIRAGQFKPRNRRSDRYRGMHLA
jgi:hypothetical protein